MQPGESGKIPVKMGTGHYSGHLSKSITVSTNVPGAGGTIALKLEGDVWQAVEVRPPSASFGRLTADAAKDPGRVQKLTIVNNLEGDASLTDVRCTNPAFRVETAVVEPGKQFELTVAFASSPGVGSVAGSIEMSTGIKESPTLSVPVNAYITPDVEVMPPNLSLPKDLPTASTRQLYVQNNATTPVKLSGVESSNPDLKLTVEEMTPGMKYKVNVDVPAGYTAPPGGDRITFKTDNASMPQVVVPVTQMAMAAGAPTSASPPAARKLTVEEAQSHLSSLKEEDHRPNPAHRLLNPNAPVKPGTVQRLDAPQMAPAKQAPARGQPAATTMPSGG